MGGFVITNESDTDCNYDITKKFERLRIGSSSWEEIELSELMNSLFSISSTYPWILKNKEDRSKDKIFIFGGFNSIDHYASPYIRLVDVGYFNDIVKYWNHEKLSETPNIDPLIGWEKYIEADSPYATQTEDKK